MHRLVLLLVSLCGIGCITTIDGSPDDGVTVGSKADGTGEERDSVVVDCTAAKDNVVVRTCTLGTTDSCTVQGTVQATQVVKNSAVVEAINGTAASFNGTAIYTLNAAEAKLLADLQHMRVLLSSSGTPASTAFEYTSDGAPFVYANPIAGLSVVTKTSANASITRVANALSTSASSCSQFRVASTDGITPVDVSFICEKTASDELLVCDGTQQHGLDYAVGASTIVNGVELNFVKTGCGAFTYDLINNGDTAVTVTSSITGVALQPQCNFNVAAGGGGYCNAAGIAGPVTLIYAGAISRGTTRASFSLPVTVRCTSL